MYDALEKWDYTTFSTCRPGFSLGLQYSGSTLDLTVGCCSDAYPSSTERSPFFGLEVQLIARNRYFGQHEVVLTYIHLQDESQGAKLLDQGFELITRTFRSCGVWGICPCRRILGSTTWIPRCEILRSRPRFDYAHFSELWVRGTCHVHADGSLVRCKCLLPLRYAFLNYPECAGDHLMNISCNLPLFHYEVSANKFEGSMHGVSDICFCLKADSRLDACLQYEHLASVMNWSAW